MQHDHEFKKALATLRDMEADRKSPALKVCRADLDDYDPYRLPSRSGEQIALRYARPDEEII